MKKHYEMPRAEKMEFNYQELVVASSNDKDGKTGSAANACYTHNTSNVATTQPCEQNANKKNAHFACTNP